MSLQKFNLPVGVAFEAVFIKKTNLSVKQKKDVAHGYVPSFGDPGQNRTGDLPLRRRLLYPTELRNHIKIINLRLGII